VEKRDFAAPIRSRRGYPRFWTYIQIALTSEHVAGFG